MMTLVSETTMERDRWWAATIIERFEAEGESRMDARRCRLFRRVVHVRAPDRAGAYLAALDAALEADRCVFDWVHGRTGRKGRWVFEGVAGLAPRPCAPASRGPFPAIRRTGETAG